MLDCEILKVGAISSSCWHFYQGPRNLTEENPKPEGLNNWPKVAQLVRAGAVPQPESLTVEPAVFPCGDPCLAQEALRGW